ncbi:hypothetical protein NBRC116588_06210 [Pyruvatibacter sp. HU-CL02332]|uniref:RNA-directed DNA polymerase n=1 Tax=Pyruvatibacter sp. HU-CL02332 TaxID=3127650 RepID=UPI0031035DDD
MFKLTKDEFNEGLKALKFHGVSGFLPPQPEWVAVLDSSELSDQVCGIDLQSYSPYEPLASYAPKNDMLVRPIDFLHIQDVVILTCLCRLLRDSIEAARLPKSKKKSFSYRVGKKTVGLYETRGAYEKYRAHTSSKLQSARCQFVATIDIADFFSNVYQHRLENSLQSAAEGERERKAVGVLCRLLGKLAGGKSYGIPTGPFACRILAEALLIDVDAALQEKGIDFVRWMDDLTVFAKSEQEAVEIIQFVSKWLREQHGLIVNQSKTDIYAKDDFVADVWKTYDEEHEHFRDLVLRMKAGSPYEDENEDVEGEPQEGEGLNSAEVVDVFDIALKIDKVPKYGLIKHILERVIFREGFEDEARKKIVSAAIANVDSILPVLDALCKALSNDQNASDRDVVKFVRPLLKRYQKPKYFVPGYVAFWPIWLVGERRLNQLKPLVKQIAVSADDLVVKRECLIALSKIGSRPDLLDIKDTYDAQASSVRPALVLATQVLGQDERKYWKSSRSISDHYEKAVFSYDFADESG